MCHMQQREEETKRQLVPISCWGKYNKMKKNIWWPGVRRSSGVTSVHSQPPGGAVTWSFFFILSGLNICLSLPHVVSLLVPVLHLRRKTFPGKWRFHPSVHKTLTSLSEEFACDFAKVFFEMRVCVVAAAVAVGRINITVQTRGRGSTGSVAN